MQMGHTPPTQKNETVDTLRGTAVNEIGLTLW
jgi:hypothetical protein